MNDKTEIARRLRRARRWKFMTQIELSRRAYMSPSAISAIECGYRRLTLDNARRIAEILEVHPLWLLDMRGKP